MTALICFSITALTLICVGVFVCVYEVCYDELTRRDAIDADKNRKEMGL